MKNLRLLTLLLIVACSSNETEIPCNPTPSLKISNPINITDVSAELKGTITPPDCDGSVISQGFVVSKEQLPKIDDTIFEVNGKEISKTISNLEKNTQYYVRVFYQNNLGVYYSEQASFKTIVGDATVTTGSITKIKAKTATINVNIGQLGGGTALSKGVVYSKTTNPTTSDTKTTSSSTSNNFNLDLENLTENTTYYLKAFVTNESGTFYGDEVNFKTLDGIILFNSSETSSINTVSAKFKTTISSDGGSNITERGVCWSTNVNPTVDDNKESNTGKLGEYTLDITNLNINTKYFVRAYAINEVGTSYSNEIEFTTRDGVATLTTIDASNILITTATSGGNITDDGGSPITSRGVCWSTTANPTINDSKSDDGTGIGAFNSALTGLASSTKYYVRAYSTNKFGTYYGNQIEFITDGKIGDISSFSDIDGNNYGAIVMCDNNVWSTENLNVSHYRNGDAIPQVTDATEWRNLKTGAWTYYEKKTSNGVKYGKLYNWYAVNDPRGLAPEGWHIPSDEEWTEITNCLGGGRTAGAKIMSLTDWQFNQGFANNQSGLTVSPGGQRTWSGTFNAITLTAYFWTSTPNKLDCCAINRYIGSVQTGGGTLEKSATYNRTSGFSIRLVKD